MKEESDTYYTQQQKLNPNLFSIFRLDGHGFSKFVKKFDMVKPFDDNFTQVMINTAMEGLTYFSFFCGFVGSDEITFCMKPVPKERQEKGGTLEFNGRIEKMNTLLAGKISTTFFIELTKIYGFEKTQNFDPHFDSRVFQVQTFEDVLKSIS